MSGYVYRGNDAGGQSALAQRNRQLQAELETVRSRVRLMSSEVSSLTSVRDKQRGEILGLQRQLTAARAAATTTPAPSQDVAVHRARTRSLLVALRAEREEAARAAHQQQAEHARRTHAETAAARAEQDLQTLRDEIAEDHQARVERVTTETTTTRENARLTQRVTDLEGALTDCQKIRDTALADRDRALGEAMTMQAALDETHTTIAHALPAMWAVRRHRNEIQKENA
ncbi:hypothetical protein [Kocuria rhizophila]|uniref:hypothetical protein n=1 Tax=Kocuria rhizophila TaxID=72000 RepID=UPI0011A27205|nr:hypothetical protein [Kocuria rhizophila]MCG7425088.1 hypothetical protein [Kocuria rhizophila]MCT2249406.1 hypothetical protein [Kocuria rhizophila]